MRHYNGAVLEFKRTYHGTSMHKYRVDLRAGHWPTDDELISLADGGNGKSREDFGGSVATLALAAKEVVVYVD